MQSSATMKTTKFAVPEIIFGRGCLNYAGLCAQKLGAKKVFLVSDEGIEKAGWVQRVMDLLKSAGIEWVYYSGVVTNPRDYMVEQGAELYRKNGTDVIIAIGGGSPMDTAKGIALLAANGGTVQDYEGANKAQHPLPPMLFITTTAGSGSDISQFCIITDSKRHVKMSIITRSLMPNISIVDPLILRTKSTIQIIHSAIDAMAHAVESYCSPIASPFTELHALRAIELIMQHLPKAVETESMNALEQLSTASVSASISFSNASLGAEHALAHSLGGHFDMAHGMLHPILLPEVMRFNRQFCLEKMADIGAVVLGEKLATPEETAVAGIQRLDDFFAGLNVERRLSEVINAGSWRVLEPICKMAVYDVCTLSNPGPTTWQDFMHICKEVW